MEKTVGVHDFFESINDRTRLPWKENVAGEEKKKNRITK